MKFDFLLTALASLVSLLFPATLLAQMEKQPETVILVHGFLGSSNDMADLQTAFDEAGYETITPDFATRVGSIETLANHVFGNALLEAKDAQTIHIVTHSMGGLLARSYLENHDIPKLERMVMLAPPNHGSEVAGELSQYSIYRQFSGPAGVELGALNLTPEKVGDYELGIIAGTASVNPIFSPILPGPDDGYVALESTPLKGMNDFITVPTSHGFITKNESSIAETLYFVENGAFDHDLVIEGFPIRTEDFRVFGDLFSNFYP